MTGWTQSGSMRETNMLEKESLVGGNRSEGFGNAKHAEMVNGRALAFGKTNWRNRKEVCAPPLYLRTDG